MARYFDEDGNTPDGLIKSTDTEANALLRPRFWNGQLHGSPASPIFTRHMRPLCEIVSESESSISYVTSLNRTVANWLGSISDRRRQP